MKSSFINCLVFSAALLALGGVGGYLVTTYSVEPTPMAPPSSIARPDSGPPLGPPVGYCRCPKPVPRRQLVDSRSQALEFAQLQALGYVDGTYDEESDLRDVIVNLESKTDPGYNFYSSRKQSGARLIDMQGRAVYQWQSPHPGAWQHAELLPNGDVIVIVKDKRLDRYDKNSKRLWSVEGRFHHDLAIHDGEIYVLWRRAERVEYLNPRVPILVDVIQVRSMEGEFKREISVLDVMHDSPYTFLLPSVGHRRVGKGVQLDVLHTNHVEVFDGRLAHLNPLYKKGNILVSMRNINSIAILDGETTKIVWLWGPTNLVFQHHPTLLDNGHILLFDNGTTQSRVLEIDPLSQQIVWQYGPKKGFFSATRGSNQRLPKGNTLITESDTGYVFEVTPKGRIVWKFANPIVDAKKVRDAIWRMQRLDPADLTFLN